MSGFGSGQGDVESQVRDGQDPPAFPGGGIPIGVATQLVRLYRVEPPPFAEGAAAVARRRRPQALERLRAIRELRAELDRCEPIAAAAALDAWARLEDVGDALGMSRSAAHRRFGGGR